MRLEAPNTPSQSMSSPWSAGTNVPSDEQRAVPHHQLIPSPQAHHAQSSHPPCITSHRTDHPHPQPTGRIHMGTSTMGEGGVVSPIQVPKMKKDWQVDIHRSTKKPSRNPKSKSRNDEIQLDPGGEGKGETVKDDHSLFIIREAWRYRFVRSQSAK